MKIVCVCWQNRTGSEEETSERKWKAYVCWAMFYSCPRTVWNLPKTCYRNLAKLCQESSVPQSLFLGECYSTITRYTGKCCIEHHFFWTFKCVLIF